MFATKRHKRTQRFLKTADKENFSHREHREHRDIFLTADYADYTDCGGEILPF
jgi:hypothetical protein